MVGAADAGFATVVVAVGAPVGVTPDVGATVGVAVVVGAVTGDVTGTGVVDAGGGGCSGPRMVMIAEAMALATASR